MQTIEIELNPLTLDRTRIADLLQESVSLQRHDANTSLRLAEEALTLAVAFDAVPEQAEATRLISESYYTLGSYEQSIHFAQLAHELFSALHDDHGSAKSLFSLALNHFECGRYEKTNALQSEASRLYGNVGSETGQIDCSNLSGSIFGNLGDYGKAIEIRQQNLEDSERIGYTYGQQRALNNIGFVYYLIDDYPRALDYLQRALDLIRVMSNPAVEALALTNIAAIDEAVGNFEQAKVHHEMALALAESVGNTRITCLAKLSLSMYYSTLRELTKARALCDESLALARGSNHHSNAAEVLQQSAKLKVLEHNTPEAIEELGQALALAKEIQNPRMISDILLTIATVHEEAGDIAHALQSYKEHLEARVDVVQRQRNQDITNLQSRLELAKQEKEAEVLRLKSTNLETEIVYKLKELTSLALQLVQSNEFLSQLKVQVSQLVLAPQDGLRIAVSSVLEEIDSKLRQEDEWKRFDLQFQQLHSDFIRTLSERCPQLTPTELKICALMKINLSSKEIANLLYTSPRTIESHRYNIKKKLNLQPDLSRASMLTGI